jgi:hypothetical protein
VVQRGRKREDEACYLFYEGGRKGRGGRRRGKRKQNWIIRGYGVW